MKRYLWLLILLVQLPGVSWGREVIWGNGNKLDLDYRFVSDLGDSGEYVLIVKPSLLLPGGDEFSYLPYLRVKGDLFKLSNEIFCGKFYPLLSPETGFVYYAVIGKEFIETADKFVLVIGPDSTLVKNDVDDAGSILDTTYTITFYDFSVTSGVSWEEISIRETGGVFYPWDFHDNTISKANAVFEASISPLSEFGRIESIVKERLGSLSEGEKDLFDEMDLYRREGASLDSLHMLMTAVGMFEAQKICSSVITDYYEVEEMWLWGKVFVNLMAKCSGLESWDSAFSVARNKIIMGEDPTDEIMGAMADVQSCAAREYFTSVTSSENYYLNALVYFFKPVAGITGYDLSGWQRELMEGYSPASTEPVVSLFTYWFSTINYFMQEVENGQMQWLSLVEKYVEVSEDWVFDILGGDLYTRLTNDFNVWKSAVLAENFPLARDTRSDIMGILNQLIESYGGN